MPYRFSSRVAWGGIRAANGIHVMKWLPNLESAELQELRAIDWRALGWRHSELPDVAVYLGTAGPSQKAALHLVDRKSRTCDAVIKVPIAEGAKAAIVREADTLAELAGEDYRHAPRLLFLDRHNGISTQQFIAGKPGSRRLRREYLQTLRSLVIPNRYTSLAAHAPAIEELCFAAPDCETNGLRSALATLDDDGPMPACRVHGDFTPWNIRRRPNLIPALIDWEDARMEGLPLHDAYHFLHIQDFLFGHRPCLHAHALAEFGGTLGLSSGQCRSIEIAYLAESYANCRALGDNAHADFLLHTLASAVRERRCTNVQLRAPSHAPAKSPADHDMREDRKRMFKTLIATLNHARVDYCLLSGYDAVPDSGKHDLDIMVNAFDQHRVPELLLRTAQATEANLVQHIQHETTATFYVLARAAGNRVSHLQVDCYTDYRKDGRTWLLADAVLRDRRRHRDFYVPSVADEFVYYLLKKVLKQSVTPHQLRRLQHLLAREPEQCRTRIAKFWPVRALTLSRLIAEQAFNEFHRQLPQLYLELQASAPVETPLVRRRGNLAELVRRLRRAAVPTGMWVTITSGTSEQKVRLVHELAQRLAPAFRRTRILPTRFTGGPAHKLLHVIADRIRSTLVLSVAGDGRHRLLGPDLVLELPAGPPDTDVEDIAGPACEAVLEWLAARTRRRLRLPDPSASACPTQLPEPQASPAGSD